MVSEFAPEKRFTDRVAQYVQHRPSYPPEVFEILQAEFGPATGTQVADVGAGTGIFSKLLLEHGYQVTAVEPNDAMRTAAEELLADRPGFASSSGTAEATGLPDDSVDLVTAAQAFHWFDVPRARTEFARILRSPGNVLLIWNDRDRVGNPFLAEYDQLLLELGTDYAALSKKMDAMLASLPEFFDPGTYRRQVVTSFQDFDFPQFVGRVLSSSYIPGPDHLRHPEVLAALKRLFNQHNRQGIVTFEYQVTMHLGQVT
ncbi:class I SAM-dependent methyltransferase [Planctomicrobium piriforme]|uniref:Methyltransferase domain-containing protein n=1 Tax=Planctomicrobium piriforme TaxID=1576369 RepID=A0A1I3TG74_9PLAN|nr:class I SAM-dependent methyltransferase [Planctomicrobium piriforme]SFJ68487.1 Methyltransferase domain-containing protein [Planctomicrobium piriforme]